MGRCFVAEFWFFFIYIRTFTNVLIHFFLIGNSQELGIEVGRCLEAGFGFIYI